MKNIIIGILAVVVIGLAVYLFTKGSAVNVNVERDDDTSDVEVAETDRDRSDDDSENDEEMEEVDETKTVIGTSVEGNDITAFHYGRGDTELLFVGGIHGGYSWNTALVAYGLMDHLEENENVIPDNVRVTVIPVLNPDGLEKVVESTGRFAQSSVPQVITDRIPGRFNANDVDLNRNFDCEWQEEGTWQRRKVSGGSAPFSEPESQAIRDYVEDNEPDAVVVWYSAAGGVYSSSCNNGISSETREITNVFAKASGYEAFDDFDSYEITGDMVNWLAKNDIPAISVLLTSHEEVESAKNLAGAEALMKYYAE